MKLTLQHTISFTPKAPFNFDASFHKPDHFTSGDNLWQPGIRWQTWLQERLALGLKFISSGTVEKPTIRLEIYFTRKLTKGEIDSLIKEVTYRFNLDLDLSAFYKTFSQDKVLDPIIQRWRGLRPGHPSSCQKNSEISGKIREI